MRAFPIFKDKLTNVMTLASCMQAIWYIEQTEDENKKPVAVRRNVKPLFEEAFRNEVPLSAISDDIHDKVLSVSPDPDIRYGKTDAFNALWESSSSIREIVMEDLIQSQLTALEFDEQQDFVDLCMRVARSLDVDTDEDVTNSQYWSQAYDDNLSAMDAVIQSVSES
tara:strand:- start:993 stop:1493 length:501 start_codon:yes stop_codon:yes gene_type:complete